ncbi:minor histocompatibility antigen H13 isoform X1 [Plutella xylostella]|uniref:minor histocompatibility antigen H13 isoform X1 n=1 Tax=Plutella xylostella TaxID=51655 RepID=UPI0020325350|nr:minor histocompatibility antigen H13 isoform X1 [Plutella xylostella]
MAESATEIPISIPESVIENVKNATERVPASIEGVAIAYLSLVVMAILPIFFGSFRSVKYLKEQKDAGERAETMSNKDALMFPLIASCALFGLYVFFQIFSKEYINMLLTGYFFFLGVLALSHLLSPIIAFLVPASIPNVPYHIHFTRGERERRTDLVNYKFTSYDVICLIISLVLGAWYLFKKHWIANNLFGIAFAVNGVELLHLNNVVTGCILLSGLFLYDIFWVFGTNVMVTVAKSFEAPIKLVFPQDLLVNGLSASNFAMLGLGDIVVPGIFIALLLRFDRSLQRGSELYFRATFTAYILGLLATIMVMHVFKHAQPALLYLVPACLATPLALAAMRGDLPALFHYEDQPALEEPAAGSSKSKKTE